MARILYVENDSTRADRVRPLLQARGHRVEVINKAGRAMMRVDEGARYDALLLHLALPGIDGVEFCRWIEQETPLKGIPKVAYTWEGCTLQLGVEDGVPCWLPVTRFLRKLSSVGRIVDAVEDVLEDNGESE